MPRRRAATSSATYSREEEVLQPEAAADIGAVQPEALLRQVEDGPGELAADAMHALAAQQQVEAGAVPAGDGGARLDRRGMDAVVDQLQLDDMGGGGEAGLGRGAVAALEAEDGVAGRLGPELRRAGGQRRAAVHHGGQGLVADLDRLGGVARLGGGLGDDEGDGLAHMADGIGGQRMAGGDDDRGDGRHHGGAGQRADALGGEVGMGQHQADAGHGPGGGGVDAGDAGMGMRGAQDMAVQRAGGGDIGDVAALAGEEAEVLGAAEGLADGAVRHGAGPWLFPASVAARGGYC